MSRGSQPKLAAIKRKQASEANASATRTIKPRAVADAVGDRLRSTAMVGASMELAKPPSKPTPLTGLRRVRCERHPGLRVWVRRGAPAPACLLCQRESGAVETNGTKGHFKKGADRR
jgi:hypothetical protein